jgi:hypothetical protein
MRNGKGQARVTRRWVAGKEQYQEATDGVAPQYEVKRAALCKQRCCQVCCRDSSIPLGIIRKNAASVTIAVK